MSKEKWDSYEDDIKNIHPSGKEVLFCILIMIIFFLLMKAR